MNLRNPTKTTQHHLGLDLGGVFRYILVADFGEDFHFDDV